MPYAPVIPTADNRRKTGMAPLELSNWFVQPVLNDAGKTVSYELIPTPGFTEEVDLTDEIFGLFQEPGVRNGELFVKAGTKLYSVSSSFVATEIGTLAAGEAEFAGLRDRLYISVATRLWRWNGSTLTEVTDVDLPDVDTFVVLNQRIVSHAEDDDTYSWSETLDGTDWESLSFGTAEQSSDAIKRLVKVSGQIIAMGASGHEILRAVSSTTLPFQNVTNQSIDESNGVLGKYAVAKNGDKVYLVGGDHASYVMSGFSLTPLPANRELELVLEDLSEADRANVRCWSYNDGTHEFFVVRPPSSKAFVYDRSTKLWHTRETLGLGYYAPKHYARAYGQHVVAVEGGSKLYTMNRTTYSDIGGDEIIRKATVRLRTKERDTIGSFTLDLKTFDHPQSGQGAAPTVMVDFSNNGRAVPGPLDNLHYLSAPAQGQYHRPCIFGIGIIAPAEGLTAHISVSDPLGFTLSGAWINEGIVDVAA